MTSGRWKSDSYKLYIQNPDKIIDASRRPQQRRPTSTFDRNSTSKSIAQHTPLLGPPCVGWELLGAEVRFLTTQLQV